MWCDLGVFNPPLLLSLVALAIGACGSDRAASRVDAANAAERPTLQDKRYLVWLQAPSERWELLKEKDAKALHPDAVAGLRRNDKCVGWVTVEPLAGRTRNQAGKAALAALSLPGKAVHFAEQVLYCSVTAWRWEAWGHDADDPKVRVAHRASFLDNAGHVYEVHARARGTVHPNLRRCMDTVTASFDMMPGDTIDLTRPAP